ncbi:PAAR domain-containing protein [Burkholderia sp. LMG 21824]|uniref:PAAR domain-containing protein n=1 Tax=Burkholderia sp. LMG 21824 TaxID=3158172 RepID=UPI003C2E3D97
MSKRVIRVGDMTTTGGIVVEGTSSIVVSDRLAALNGDRATCGNCEGMFAIAGSAVSVISSNRCVAVEGDPVLCPCGKNRLIAGAECTFFIGGDGGRNDAMPYFGNVAYSPERFAPARGTHDDQFVIRDVRTKEPLSNVRYWIKDRSGNVLASGVSDGRGCTERVRTERAQTLTLVIED